MASTTPNAGTPLELAAGWLEELERRGSTTLTMSDRDALTSLVVSAGIERSLDNVASWLRTRAEMTIRASDDPEQPGWEEQARASRQGAYNGLHAAANAVERGEAALRPEKWPAYMQAGHAAMIEGNNDDGAN